MLFWNTETRLSKRFTDESVCVKIDLPVVVVVAVWPNGQHRTGKIELKDFNRHDVAGAPRHGRRLRAAAGRGLTAAVLSVLVLASGAAALALEVLWIRDFALWFGSTAAAAAVVLSVYFAGLALGARVGGRLGRAARRSRTYARLEASVALVGRASTWRRAPGCPAPPRGSRT